MAKVAFSKLDLKKNQEVTNLQINDEISIEIKQYLPIDEKLKMISEIVNLSQGDSNIVNYGKIDIFTLLGIITYYTNINFTEKQMEDPAKLYDLFVGNGLDIDILRAIPKSEINFISNVVGKTAEIEEVCGNLPGYPGTRAAGMPPSTQETEGRRKSCAGKAARDHRRIHDAGTAQKRAGGAFACIDGRKRPDGAHAATRVHPGTSAAFQHGCAV